MGPIDYTNQSSLFDKGPITSLPENKRSPLRELLRPDKLEDIVGNQKTIKSIMQTARIAGRHIIIYGPPGIGKTTTCDIVAHQLETLPVYYQPAIETLSILKQKVLELSAPKNNGINKFLFIDEIHRLDKKQQDFLLPHLEKGAFQLLAATTELPQGFLSSAMLSRVNIFKFHPLENQDLLLLISRAENYLKINLTNEQKLLITDISNGDGRKVIQLVEKFYSENLMNKNFPIDKVAKIINHEGLKMPYDKQRHYDLLSALIKSMRSNDIDEALLWLACILEEGGDLNIICRRLIIFASEDIGNAAPYALPLTTATKDAVNTVGLPEAKIILGQTVSFLAKAKKSRTSYNAIKKACQFVSQNKRIDVPLWRKNIKTNQSIVKGELEHPKFYDE